MTKYDYAKDTATVDGTKIDLAPFRRWLLYNHEQLCSSHFVKAVTIAGKTKFTYDWQHIYFVADQYGFTKNYIDEVNSESPGKFPGIMPSDQ